MRTGLSDTFQEIDDSRKAEVINRDLNRLNIDEKNKNTIPCREEESMKAQNKYVFMHQHSKQSWKSETSSTLNSVVKCISAYKYLLGDFNTMVGVGQL